MKKRLLSYLLQGLIFIIGMTIFDQMREIPFNWSKTLLFFVFYSAGLAVIFEIGKWVGKQKQQ